MLSLNRRSVALLAVVVLVAVAGCSGASNSAGSGGSGGSDLSAQSAGDAGGERGGVGSYYDADGDRVIVREADMDLRVDNFTRAFRSTRRIAARYGGYVGDRSQHSRGEWDEGQITVRVPPKNFSAARDDLTALGHLEDEDVSVRDFTSEYNDRAARIEDLRQEEQSLQDLLNRTNDTEEARQIRADLREVRGQLRDLRQQQASLQRREAMSTIRLHVHEPVGEQPPKNYRSSFGFDDAFMEAFYGGLTAVKYVVVFFGYAIPIGLALLPLAAFGLGLVAGFRRLRRFSATVLFPSGTDEPAADAPESEPAADTGDETGNDADGSEASDGENE